MFNTKIKWLNNKLKTADINRRFLTARMKSDQTVCGSVHFAHLAPQFTVSPIFECWKYFKLKNWKTNLNKTALNKCYLTARMKSFHSPPNLQFLQILKAENNYN